MLLDQEPPESVVIELEQDGSRSEKVFKCHVRSPLMVILSLKLFGVSASMSSNRFRRDKCVWQ
jgi:hypothetical protein